jgi:hypothetical protein
MIRHSGKVLLCALLVTVACGKKSSSPEPVSNAASIGMGGPINFSNVTGTTLTATWNAASSSSSPAASIQYYLVYSTTNNISTVASAQANGTIAMNWTVNTLTANISGLTPSTNYYFSVLAKDTANLIVMIETSVSTLCSGKVMFITNVSNGNLGGVSGADGICNSNKPSGFGASTFKAMLTDSTNRAACNTGGSEDCSNTTVGRMDWVFGSNQTICTADYLKIVGTTDGIGILHVTQSNTLSSTTTTTWTGFDIVWGNGTVTCNGWTSGSSGVSGINGTANGTVSGGSHSFIAANTPIPKCNVASSIYCVEQ